MGLPVIALFGGAERGLLETAYYCDSLHTLFELLGEPPEDSQGLFFAVQTILYGNPLVYFRVREEGVSLSDYLLGLEMLSAPDFPIKDIRALFLPGVGSKSVVDEGLKVCRLRRSFFIVNENDFYDLLTD